MLGICDNLILFSFGTNVIQLIVWMLLLSMLNQYVLKCWSVHYNKYIAMIWLLIWLSNKMLNQRGRCAAWLRKILYEVLNGREGGVKESWQIQRVKECNGHILKKSVCNAYVKQFYKSTVLAHFKSFPSQIKPKKCCASIIQLKIRILGSIPRQGALSQELSRTS